MEETTHMRFRFALALAAAMLSVGCFLPASAVAQLSFNGNSQATTQVTPGCSTPPCGGWDSYTHVLADN